MLENTIGILLAGGGGTRLFPLTEERAKPAVPFGGKYRIVDFTLSNCLHSGLRRILVLTQYKSHSLQKHLRDGWSIFNPSVGEYITTIPPQMRSGESWYAGTADAVHQNLYLLERSGAEHVIILSGDHIYRMDYAAMMQFHRDSAADATIACMKAPIEEASAFGVMTVDAEHQITEFDEKPLCPNPMLDDENHALVSMGIYIFSCDLLCELLEADHGRDNSAHDFGKDIIPRLIKSHGVYGYRFGGPAGRVRADGYWRDVGTIDSYFEANMDFLAPRAPLDLYQRDWAVRTVEGQGPPAKTVSGPGGAKSTVDNAMMGSGAIVAGGRVSDSILSRNVYVKEGAVVERSILFDDVRVGVGAKLKNCIVDKRVKIPAGESIGYDLALDRERFTVSENGVVVVPQEYQFPATAEEAAEDDLTAVR